MIYTKNHSLTEFDRREIMRYAGVAKENAELKRQLEECIAEYKNIFAARVCYIRCEISVEGNRVIFPFGSADSSALAKNLSGCREAVVFAATVGTELDRQIRRQSSMDMARAVWLQAIGTERIECLCNIFNKEIEAEERKNGRYLRPRFSPGYGDFSIAFQKNIFSVLECKRKIGVSLSEGCIMLPSKSVTAVIGISDKKCHIGSGCEQCGKADCVYREEDRK